MLLNLELQEQKNNNNVDKIDLEWNVNNLWPIILQQPNFQSPLQACLEGIYSMTERQTDKKKLQRLGKTKNSMT